MRVAVVGWYGHNNGGDERMLYCLKRFFADDQLVPINGFAGIREHWDEVNRCDYILFGGGGVIMRRTGKHASLFAALRPPMSCVGISVEAVNKDNIELLEILKEKSEFILVRDAASVKAFNNHPKVVVGPDLTFLYPFEIVEPQVEDRCGVNLLPWSYWKCEYSDAYDVFMRRLNRRFPFVRKYYPLLKWEPEKAIEILRRNFSDLAPICLYSEAGRATDAGVLRQFFPKVENHFSPRYMAGCRMIVAMRLHALIFACQMGIPFVSLSYMPKNHEFCKSIDVEQNSVDLFSLSRLAPAVQRIKETYDDARSHLLDVRSQNQREITALMKQLTWQTSEREMRHSA